MNRIYLVSLFCFLFATSCIDEIQLTVPGDGTDAIAIQGRIVYGEPSFVTVGVSNAFDFSTDSRNAVVVKSVEVMDDLGNSMEVPSVDIGVYEAALDESSPLQAVIGRSYRVRVVTLDNREFESDFDPLLPVAPIESIELGFVEKLVVDNIGGFDMEEKLAVFVNTVIDNSAEGGLLWEVENIFQITDTPTDARIPMKTCYITEAVGRNKVSILQPNELTDPRVDRLELFDTDINFKFGEGIYFIVNQFSLSQAAYDYWEQVQILTERTGSMFDDPVGEVTTNIRNVLNPEDRAYGFFSASSYDFQRIRVTEEFTGPVTPYCPPVVNNPPPFGCPFGICCNCLDVPRSTTEVPDFWED